MSKRKSISRARIAQLETGTTDDVQATNLVSTAKAFGFSIEQLKSNNSMERDAEVRLQPMMGKAPVVG